MFDIGFSEILLVMVVALIVIGPERLPQVARSVGQWWGRIQRYVSKVKQEINTSIELDELRKMQRDMKAEADALQRSVQQAGNEIEQDVRALERDIEQTARDLSQPVAPDAAPKSKPGLPNNPS